MTRETSKFDFIQCFISYGWLYIYGKFKYANMYRTRVIYASEKISTIKNSLGYLESPSNKSEYKNANLYRDAHSPIMITIYKANKT